MANNFEEEYSREKELISQYKAALKENDEETYTQVKASYAALKQSISDKGKAYTKVYKRFKEMKEKENEVITVNEYLEKEEAEKLAEAFKECGITEFALIGHHPGVIDIAYFLTLLGFAVDSIIQVNTGAWSMENGYKKVCGLLMVNSEAAEVIAEIAQNDESEDTDENAEETSETEDEEENENDDSTTV